MQLRVSASAAFRRFALGAGLWLVIGTGYAATQATFHVDPSAGDDRRDGRQEATAFRTLERARQAVDAINDAMSGDIVVLLRGGTHRLASTLALRPADSGTNGFRVIYRNTPGESPVVSGGVDLSGGWTRHDSAKNIFRKTGMTAEFRQLYVNGRPAIRARTPNRDNDDTFGPFYRIVSVDGAAERVRIKKEEIANWSGLSAVEMVMNPHWYHYRGRIAAFTTDATLASVSFQSAESTRVFGKTVTDGNTYWSTASYFFENSYDFLDREGEWFLDSVGDTLYYKPRSGEDLAIASIIAPSVEKLIDLAGTAATARVKNVGFEGIVFAHAAWNSPTTRGAAMTQGARETSGNPQIGAITVQYADRVEFRSCDFHHLGLNAVTFVKGVAEAVIADCTFRELAGNGVVVHDAGNRNPAAGDSCDAIRIVNNRFTRVGQEFSNAIPIVSYFVKRLLVEANEISDCPYMGMQTGGQGGAPNTETGMKDNIIRHNFIHDVMQLHDDGGAIYTLGRQPGTFVYENNIANVRASGITGNYPVAGLYADNYSEFVTFEHNVVVNATRTTYEQTGNGAKNISWLNTLTAADAAIARDAGNCFYVLPTRIEAETMTLANYGTETHERYSNDTGIRALGSAVAVARVAFPGASNVYNVDVAYLAEDGGPSTYRLYVGGLLVTTWTSSAAPAGTGMQVRHKVVPGVAIAAGQEVRIEGTPSAGAAARLDYVEFYRRAGSAERAGAGGAEPGRLVNLSVRADLLGAGETLTLGLVLAGGTATTSQPLLVRAAGPALRAFGVGSPLDNPRIDFYAGSARLAANEGWGGSDSLAAEFARVGAFPFAPGSRDSALQLHSLVAGAYSAAISGPTSGTVLAEVYDASPPSARGAATLRLVNLSILKYTSSAVIAGLVVAGNNPCTVLLRAVGPSLAGFGVRDVMGDPQLTLFRGANTIARNDNWGGQPIVGAAIKRAGAFVLPATSRDAVLVATLEPGSYTVHTSDLAGAGGHVLLEIYEVP